MKPKTLLIVVALLAALSGAAWFFNRPETPSSLTDARVGLPVLDPAAAEKAARVRLTESGKTVILARAGDAGWQVVSYHDLPADFAKLSSLVKSLVSARIDRLVTTSPDRIARLGFTDTSITLLDSADKPLLELNLGKYADGGGRFLRFGSTNHAYVARLDAWLDAEPRNWADTTLTRFNSADIAKVTLTIPGETTPATFTRADAKSAFTAGTVPDGKRLKADAVTSLIDALANLRFSETSATDDPQAVAARAAARTVTLTTFDGKTLTFAVGRQPERTVVKPDALKPKSTELIAAISSPSEASAKEGPASILPPVTEKLPAGPVFAFITHSDASAPVNALMKKRAFQVGEFTLTSLPATNDALFEAVPPPPPSTPSEAAK